jgi:cephalosporin-C deacetylase-like acetyl esterase
VCAPGPLSAQAPAAITAAGEPTGNARQTLDSLIRVARGNTDRARREARSRAAWEPLRSARHEELRDMLALDPWPKRCALNVRTTHRLEGDDYAIETVAFESLPKVYVTANLYLPRRQDGPAPAVLYACGHAYSKHGAKVKYQRHGAAFARNGYVALVLDPIQLSETFALHYGLYYRELYDWYARGYTPAGVEAWNAIRGVDYLASRPEVDAARIGVTGRSGGATVSLFAAALDPRIRVAAPIMGVSAYAEVVRQDAQRRHCDCMFPINARGHDPIHFGALIAPRPLLLAHGVRDLGFPAAGYREFAHVVGALYADYGVPDSFRNIEVDTDHADSDYLREQVLLWFDRFLGRRAPRIPVLEYREMAESALSVFQGNPPDDARNFQLHEFFAPRPRAAEVGSPAAWERRRSELLGLLRERVLGNLKSPEAPERIETRPGPFFAELRVRTADSIDLRMLLRRPTGDPPSAPALLYVASPGEDPEAIRQLLHPAHLRNASIRLAVYPRGWEETPWVKSVWKTVLRNAMLTGRSLDELRLGDVATALRVLRGQPGVDPARITIWGRGEAGVLGLYAALLDSSVLQVIVSEPPASHAQGPIFLNVLRYTDIPEAAALLAPRRLAFYARMPAAFEPTARLYALAGARDRLLVISNVEAVVEGRYGHDFPAEV